MIPSILDQKSQLFSNSKNMYLRLFGGNSRRITFYTKGRSPYNLCTSTKPSRVFGLNIPKISSINLKKLKLSQFEHLKRLIIKEITSQTFFISHKNLESLIIESGNIQKIKINAPKLKTLKIQHTDLLKISFDDLNIPNIEEIEINFNDKLSFIQISSFNKLNKLNLNFNVLKKFEIKNNSSLSDLSLADNQLKCLNLKLVNLEFLSLYSNQLQSLKIHAPFLKFIDTSDNRNLKKIDLSKTKLIQNPSEDDSVLFDDELKNILDKNHLKLFKKYRKLQNNCIFKNLK